MPDTPRPNLSSPNPSRPNLSSPIPSRPGAASPGNRLWRFGAVEFDEARREVRVNKQPRAVEAKPLLLLETLLEQAGDVVRKDDLLSIVWHDRTVVEQSLTTAVSKLRAALDDESRTIIEAVHGLGYRIGVPIELRAGTERPRLALTLQAGEAVPNRQQWRLEKPLGKGGANDVWLAHHKTTGEKRVFKFADTAQRLDALKREASLSVILHKALHDRADLARIAEWNFDLRPYFIESRYGGDSLNDWVAAHGGAHAIPLATRIAIVAKVARTVAAAHDVGVLHRDIKPDNILVTGSVDDPAICLVDFGSGRLTDAARLEAATITGLRLSSEDGEQSSNLGGTLRYMPREIIAGGPPTIAADVYALGILLYEMIVADLNRPLGAGWEADIDDPLLREDVRAAAAGDPAMRLPSARLLVERLATLEARRGQAERRRLDEDAARRRAQQEERASARRPWLVLGIASLVLGFVATSIFAISAVRSRNEARRQATVARHVNAFLTDDLLGRGNPFKSGKADETLMAAATGAEPRIAERFAQEPLVAASLYAALAQAFAGRSAYAEARIGFDKAVAAYGQAEGPNSADAVILRLRQVSMEIVSSQADSTERAKHFVENARQVVPGLGARASEAQAWLLDAEGMLQLFGGDMAAAVKAFTSAANMADAMPEKFDEHTRFDFRQREAFSLMRLQEYEKAQALLTRLLSEEIKRYGKRHPDTLLALQTQATLFMTTGKNDAAIGTINDMMPDLIDVYGTTHRLTLQAYNTRAQAEGNIERYEDAVRDDMVVYNASLAKQGSHAFYTFASLSDAAVSECRSGHEKSGLQHALQALDDAKATLGEAHVVTHLIAVQSVAFCLIVNKEFQRAASYLNGLDDKSAGQFLSDSDPGAVVALLRAAIAINTGDIEHGRALLKHPLQAFSDPQSDRFNHRWSLALNAMASAGSGNQVSPSVSAQPPAPPSQTPRSTPHP